MGLQYYLQALVDRWHYMALGLRGTLSPAFHCCLCFILKTQRLNPLLWEKFVCAALVKLFQNEAKLQHTQIKKWNDKILCDTDVPWKQTRDCSYRELQWNICRQNCLLTSYTCLISNLAHYTGKTELPQTQRIPAAFYFICCAWDLTAKTSVWQQFCMFSMNLSDSESTLFLSQLHSNALFLLMKC